MTTESRIERYYYLKDPTNGHYLGCVCLYRNPETCKFSRGVSLCNTEMDRFIKARARGIAYGRAVNAMKESESDCPFGPIDEMTYIGPKLAEKVNFIREKYGLELAFGDEICTSMYDPILTSFERRMWDDVLNPWPEKAK